MQTQGDQLMAAIANHIANSRRLKKGTACLAGLLLAGTCGWSGYQNYRNPEHPEGARYSRTQIRDRAIQIGLALNGSIRVIGDPMIHAERYRVHDAVFAKRKMWTILCETDHRQLNLSIDDASGRLTCLVMDGSAPKTLGRMQQVTVKTERDAVVTAAARLRVLQALPQTAQIALRDKPFEEPKQNAWYVSWLVKNTAQSEPYTIKMALNRQTGLPTYLMNLEQKG